MAAPGGLADDVALLAHCPFGQINDAGPVNHVQKDALPVEDAFVMLLQGRLVVKAERLQSVNGLAQARDFFGGQDAGDKREAVFVQGLGHFVHLVKRERFLQIQ